MFKFWWPIEETEDEDEKQYGQQMDGTNEWKANGKGENTLSENKRNRNKTERKKN